MKISQLSIAVTAILSVSVAHSAGLERSTQSIEPLFEEGNYAELSYAYVKPDLPAKDALGNQVDNMQEEYDMTNAFVKVAPSDNTALAVMYSQPWGVDTAYPTGNIFNNSLGHTQAHVEAEGLGLIAGGKPMDNVWLYGGVEYQRISGNIKGAQPLGADSATAAVLTQAGVTAEQYSLLLAGQKAGVLDATQTAQLGALQSALETNVPTLAMAPTLYNLDFEEDDTLVPMIGMAFEKPEIALRAAVTYRGPAEYHVNGTENIVGDLGTGATPLTPIVPGNTEVTFPQSVSFDFQTGLSAKYQLLGMVNARWVDWSEFEVNPPLNATQTGETLAEYTDDQYSVEVAIGKQFTPKLSGEIRAIYDSGTGVPLSLLGPYDAVTGVALGAKYDVTQNLSVSGGAQYYTIEGGTVPSDNPDQPALTVDDGDGYAVGLKVGYHF